MLEFHGKMLVKNFKQAMLDTFGLRIKVHQGFSMGQTADDSATLAATRSGVADSTSATIALTQSMTVEQAEARFRYLMLQAPTLQMMQHSSRWDSVRHPRPLSAPVQLHQAAERAFRSPDKRG